MAWKRFLSAFFATLLHSIHSVHGETDGGKATYDFIVLGGGIGGLVTANRLSENPDAQVLIIEAGYSELDNRNSSYPEINGNTDQINWNYQSVPQVYADGRPKPLAAGRGIGGSSLINGIRPPYMGRVGTS